MANEFKVRKGLSVNGSGSVILDVQGSQGQLFSVTDQLSGSLFSVSDISGIPVMEAFSDNTVRIGRYGAEAIKVSGSVASVTGSFTGSFTGSLFGTASQALTASYALLALSASNAPGFTFTFSQSLSAVTWSINHNMNTRTPLVQVYDINYNQLIPNQVVSVTQNLTEVRFDYGQNGYAVLSSGMAPFVTGSTSLLNQTVASLTWSFAHNLNSKYINFEVYDSTDYTMIPSAIRVIDTNNAEIHMAYPTTGRAVANFSGISGAPNATTASYALTATTASYALTSSLALTASFVLPLSQSVIVTGSLITTGSISLERGSLRIGDGTGGFSGFSFSTTLRQTNNNAVTLLGALQVDSTAGANSYISGSGNFGVGKSTPTAKLDVSGSMLVTGSVRITDNLAVVGTLTPGGMQNVRQFNTDTSFLGGSISIGKQSAAITGYVLDVSGSALISGSLVMSGSFTQNGFSILTRVSQSLNYADDTAAAAGGVPLGGLYRNGNFILIRLS